MSGEYVQGSVWFFAPNKGAAIFFTIAWAATTGFHLWQTIHYKSWRLTGLYVVCGVLFTAGFIVRVIGAFEYENVIKYIVSVCLIYAAPPLYELANYYILGRILYYVPYYSPIHPGRVLTTFAAISMVIEALNGNGAAFVANQTLSDSQRSTGKSLLKAALILQLVVAGLFTLLATYFHVKCFRRGINNAKVNSALTTLYISTALIVCRTIYRVVEYFEIAEVNFWKSNFNANDLSPIIRYEWFFYVFEVLLMFANSILLNVRHPRRYLPKSTKVYLSKDGVTEIQGPGYKQERNFFMTLIDPFDILGMLRGKDQQTRFWDAEGTTENKTVANPSAAPGRQPQSV